jgi:hypothetical protein
MNQQEQKRTTTRVVRKFRKMLMTDPFFEKRFDIQEVQMSYLDGVIYKRYVFIFKHPSGAVIKKETAWYNIWEITNLGFHGLFNNYNEFIMTDMKWNGYDKVSALSKEIMTQYEEAYKELSK